MSTQFGKMLFWWCGVVLWYGGISFLSHQPNLPGPASLTQQFFWFKSAHLLVYGILSCLVLLAWESTWLWRRQSPRLLTVFIFTFFTIFVLASLDELHQYFVPGRGPHIRDVVIDLFSTLLVFLAWSGWHKQHFALLKQNRYNLDK